MRAEAFCLTSKHVLYMFAHKHINTSATHTHTLPTQSSTKDLLLSHCAHEEKTIFYVFNVSNRHVVSSIYNLNKVEEICLKERRAAL